MSMADPIAIIGVTGGVGSATVRQLRHWKIAPLRLGLRNPSLLNGMAAESTTESIHQVDCQDTEQLASFISGARVVVNCSGPYSVIGHRVTDAAVAAGVDVIDVNGTYHDSQALRDKVPPTMTAITGCGMSPGLTGALPLWAARQLDRVTAARLLIGGRDFITPAGAADIIDAARRRGRMSHPGMIKTTTIPDDIADLFLDDADAFPYQDDELEYLSSQLMTDAIEAWAVYAGKASQALLIQALRNDINLDEVSRQVARASRADVAGLMRYQQLVVDLFNGIDSVTPALRVRLRAQGASELTGAVLATATRGLICDRFPRGVYLGAEVMATDWAMGFLRCSEAVIQCDVRLGDELNLSGIEEGAL